jgi:hypothetical protein
VPVKTEIKYGFWLGLGVAVAFLILGILQAFILRAVSQRNG